MNAKFEFRFRESEFTITFATIMRNQTHHHHFILTQQAS